MHEPRHIERSVAAAHSDRPPSLGRAARQVRVYPHDTERLDQERRTRCSAPMLDQESSLKLGVCDAPA
jgi:hypothetical protein